MSTKLADLFDRKLLDRTAFARSLAAAHDPASGPEPATGAPNAVGVDAGSGEAS